MKKLRNLLIALFFLPLASCQRQPQEPLQFGIMGAVEAIPFMMAQQLGFLDGIPIDLIVFTAARERDAALQAGALDGIVADLVAVALYQEAGFDLRITGAANGTFALVGAEPLTDVALSANTATELVLDLLQLESITKTEIPQIPLRLELLKEGQVSAALLPEPYASIAQDAGFQTVASTQELGFNPFITAFTYQAIQEQQDIIAKLFEAYNKAVAYLNTYPLTPYHDFLSHQLGFPENTWQAYTLPKLEPNTAPNPEHLEMALDWLLKQGLITERPQNLLSPLPFW